MKIKANGFEISYAQAGQGEDIIMLHGWGYGKDLLMPFAQSLSDSYRVTVPEMPGHGESAEPETPITVYDYAETVYGFMNALNIESAYIVGHSFGCRLAAILAAKHPEKVKRMVLCGAAGIRDRRSTAYYIKTYTYKLTKLFVKTFIPSKFDEWRAQKGSDDYRKLSDTMKATFSNIVNEDLSYLLPEIKAPVFLVWGENDTATPLWMAEKIESLIPDCAKTVYMGRTHYAFLEEAPRTAAIIRTFFKE